MSENQFSNGEGAANESESAEQPSLHERLRSELGDDVVDGDEDYYAPKKSYSFRGHKPRPLINLLLIVLCGLGMYKFRNGLQYYLSGWNAEPVRLGSVSDWFDSEYQEAIALLGATEAYRERVNRRRDRIRTVVAPVLISKWVLSRLGKRGDPKLHNVAHDIAESMVHPHLGGDQISSAALTGVIAPIVEASLIPAFTVGTLGGGNRLRHATDIHLAMNASSGEDAYSPLSEARPTQPTLTKELPPDNTHVSFRGIRLKDRGIQLRSQINSFHVFRMMSTYNKVLVMTPTELDRERQKSMAMSDGWVRRTFQGRLIRLGSHEYGEMIRNAFATDYLVPIPEDAVLIIEQDPPSKHWWILMVYGAFLLVALYNLYRLAVYLSRMRQANT